tara:strand:- start:828 stop:1079 length:252 start_codon:yes stop_codon:yes gene_type:complete
MKIQIFTIPGCSYCDKVKTLMKRAKLDYDSYVVGQDISRETMVKRYPLAKGYPYVIIDGEPIGGLHQTAKFLLDKGLVSSRKK